MSTDQSTIQLPNGTARGSWERPAPAWSPGPTRDRARNWLVERQGSLGLGGLVAAGLVISLSAAQTEVLLPQTIQLGNAYWLGNAFGRHAIDLHSGGMLTVLGLMFISYAIVVRATAQLTTKTILMGIAALHVLMLLAPPLLSNDVFSYIAYGRIGRLYHSNPYLSGPSVIRLDRVYPYIDAHWIYTPTDYGPLFTAFSYLLAPFAIATNVIGYKLIAAFSSLVVVWVVWKAAALRGVDQVKAVAFVGLNPVIVVFGVGGGHNDMLMLAVMMVGLYALLLQKERTSGVLMVAAAAIKLTGGLLLPFAIADGAGRRDGRHGARALVRGAGIAALVAAALSLALFGLGSFHLLGTLRSVQGEGGIHSIPGLLLSGLGLSSISGAVGIVLDLGVAVSVISLLTRVYQGRLDWITAAAWATVAVLITAGLLLPWYVGWLVPLAVLSDDRRLPVVALVLTLLGLTTI